MANAQHSAESVEHFTPSFITARSRAALGGVVELDPATCVIANALVGAVRIYTEVEDGLAHDWRGRTFLNPPGGITEDRESKQRVWWNKLVHHWRRHEIECAIFVGFSVEILQRSQQTEAGKMCVLDFPFCVPSSRIPFDTIVEGKRVAGKSPTHANVIAFLPPRWDWRGEKFAQIFADVGKVIL